MSTNIVVNCDGCGDYTSISEAIEAVPASGGAVIIIKNGVYNEKIVVDKPDITFVGENQTKTVLRWNDGANAPDETGEPMGTFKTATLHVTKEAVGFQMYNMTVENNAGIGAVAGQALALYADCDKMVAKDCRFCARQDTLLAAPMYQEVDSEIPIENRQLYTNCYIEGDVDFIFGGAVAMFEDCTIYSLERSEDLPCYITAACTPKELKYGYVFKNCHLTGSAKDNSVYLGRPWRGGANVTYIGCKMDKCVCTDGFKSWNDTDRHKTARYCLNGNYGDGYKESDLVEWCRVISDREAQEYTKEKMFNSWMPEIKSYKELI